MLLRMKVQHETDQRAFQPRAQPFGKSEPGAGYFAAAFKIENTEFFADLIVSQRLFVKFARLTPAANLRIGFLVSAHRDRGMGYVRDI